MNIELKNIKICQFASEETLCFEAVGYINGKRAFTVHNEGHGGCNSYHALDADLLRQAEEWAKAQPRIKTNIKDDKDPSGFWHMDSDLDAIVDEMLTVHDVKTQLKRLLKKVVLCDAGNIYTLKAKAIELNDALRASILKRYPQGKILNDMAFDDAMVVFRNPVAA